MYSAPCVLSYFFSLSVSFYFFAWRERARARDSTFIYKCAMLWILTLPIRAKACRIRADNLHNANLNFEWKGSMKILLYIFLLNNRLTTVMRLILINILIVLSIAIGVVYKSPVQDDIHRPDMTSAKLKIPSNWFIKPIDGDDGGHQRDQICIQYFSDFPVILVLILAKACNQHRRHCAF